jgi:hypothetical protein
VQIIMKGYGEVKLTSTGELVPGEITIHAEGWVAVAPMPPADRSEVRWFPNWQVAEVIWRKSLAIRPSRPKAAS